MKLPTFKLERRLVAQGYKVIAGIDEVGCGALAGPVVAAAVVLPLDSRLGMVRDSKLFGREQRARFLPRLLEKLQGFGIGEVSVEEINKLGLRPATLLAMRRAHEALARETEASFVLVDAWKIPGLSIPQQAVIRGDRLVKSIAAASIVAKTHRDNIMEELAQEFPGYGFEDHRGYATARHKLALRRLGVCPAHRLNYAPVRAALDPIGRKGK